MRQRAFWIGVGGGVVAAILVGLFAVPATGVLNMSAAQEPGLLDWWGNTAWHSSLQWRAPSETLPSEADVELGLSHYGQTCIQCHGAPDVERAEWAKGMLPKPPHLWEKHTQDMSDGMLHRIIDQGVGRTGMPAFGEHHDDHEIWSLVAAVRQLDDLSAEQRQKLSLAAERMRHSHDAHPADNAPAGEDSHGHGEGGGHDDHAH